MLFVTFFELRPSLGYKKIAEVTSKFLKTRERDPNFGGIKIINMLLTPGGKGVTIVETDKEENLHRFYIEWENALPGIFERYEIYPAVTVDKAVSLALEEPRYILA
jgi:hypothetical protein